MLHGNLRSIFDLIRIQAVQGRQRRRRHGAGAADFCLASAFRAGNAGIGADHVAHQACHRQRAQDFLLRKATVCFHIVHHGRQNPAASAGWRRHYNMFIRVFFADRIGIGRDDAVHSHIRAFIVAAFPEQRSGFSGHAEASGQRSLRSQAANNGFFHGLPYRF